jgi:hypothetical protein
MCVCTFLNAIPVVEKVGVHALEDKNNFPWHRVLSLLGLCLLPKILQDFSLQRILWHIHKLLNIYIIINYIVCI